MTNMTKQTEAISTERALKLALEALEAEGDAWIVLERKAKAALREALTSVPDWASEAKEQPAQQKLVPYEPSIDMQEQGSIASGYDLSQARAKKVYQAMIDMHDVMMEREPTDEWFRLQAGYPEQPAQQHEPVSDRENAIIRFALHQFMSNAYSNMNAAAQDKDSRHYTMSAVEKFAKDAKDAEALLSRLQFKAPQPAQRKPLTDEQLLHFVDIHVGAPSMAYPLDNSDWITFARAIEAAHGIKEHT